MNLARFSIRQPILVNLFTVVVLAGGAIVLTQMNRESYPLVQTGWASIVTVLPGASPEEIESLITAPIEDVVADVEGVHMLGSYSSESVSVIRIQFDSDLEEVAPVLAEVTSAVGRMRGLPAQAQPPIVREETVRFVSLSVAIHGNVPDEVLQSTGRLLERRLRRVEGVSEVEAIGLVNRTLSIDVQPELLNNSGVTLRQVAGMVIERSSNLASGVVDDGDRTQVVRGTLHANTAESLGEIVVRPDAEGGVVRLRHVAEVTEGYPDDGVVARVEGERAILLNLHRGESADSIRLNDAALEVIEGVRRSAPEGLTITTYRDASREVSQTLNVLYQDATIGLILVVATLFFFLGGRNALMAALGVPVAIAGGLIAMHALGITLNLLSVAAMIWCTGMVVDDSIVIIDNIYRHVENGSSRVKAAIVGTQEVFWPVISANVTTCVAFLPLFLMTGVLGEFFEIIPKVVIVLTCMALAEALVVLPSHMADFGGQRRVVKTGPIDRLGDSIKKRYLRLLTACLRRPILTLVATYTLFTGLVIATVATMDVVLLTAGDVDAFDVRVRMPADSSVHATDEVVEEVERRLLALRTDDVELITTTRGMSRSDFGPLEEDYLAMATVSMVPLDLRSSDHAGRDLLERASSAFDDLVGPVEVVVVQYAVGPPVGAPVLVQIAGEDPERLDDIASLVRAELAEVPGVRHIENSASADKRELRVEVDEGRAAMHGVTPQSVHEWLRLAFAGAPIAHALVDNENIDIVLRLDEDVSGPEELSAMTVPAQDGRNIPLSDIAEVSEGRLPTHIRRNDRRRGIRVTAELEADVTSQAANRALRDRLQPIIDANPDVSIVQAGEFEETNRSVQSLILAFMLAIAVVYAILAAQFRSMMQPLVVLTSVPLSLIGVMVGLLLSGTSVGLVALVAVVGLVGIVLNDAIVLLDFINERRRAGDSLYDSIVEACNVRVRPILANSVTAIVGVLPLALAGAEAPLLAPMANVIAWGLTTSTLFTLTVVPCLVLLSVRFTDRMSEWTKPLWTRIRGDAPGEEGEADSDEEA